MEQKTSVLRVSGMTCPSCIRHVERALHEVEGVEQVEVHLREGKAIVRHEASTELTPMIESLRDAGYEAVPS